MEKVSGSSPLTSTKITQSNDCVIFLSVNVLCANKFARAVALNRYALTLHFASKLARSAIKRVRSKGQEPNRRLAFGKRLRFLALCSVFAFADTLCRLVVNLRNRGPRGILCTRGEKAHTSIRVSIVGTTMRFQKCSYRGPRGILCTRGEKAQTSKRVSVIACDNVISKAKFAP